MKVTVKGVTGVKGEDMIEGIFYCDDGMGLFFKLKDKHYRIDDSGITSVWLNETYTFKKVEFTEIKAIVK